MPQVVSSDRSVVEAVARALTFDAFQVIAIGGNTLAGKTTLARKLAKALNISCFHLDDFINANPGIDLPRVKQVIDESRCANRPILIEGAGVRRTLFEVGVKQDLLIHLSDRRRNNIQVTDDFYSNSTVRVPINKLIGYYDDQTSSTEEADILVVESE